MSMTDQALRDCVLVFLLCFLKIKLLILCSSMSTTNSALVLKHTLKLWLSCVLHAVFPPPQNWSCMVVCLLTALVRVCLEVLGCALSLQLFSIMTSWYCVALITSSHPSCLAIFRLPGWAVQWVIWRDFLCTSSGLLVRRLVVNRQVVTGGKSLPACLMKGYLLTFPHNHIR